jgi:type I restriction enzyme S subunit
MLFRPNLLVVNPKYLLSIIISDYVYNQAKKKNSGSTVGHVNVADIKKFNILLPPIELQTRFATIIEKIEEQKVLVRKALKESEDLFQRLMQDLFGRG